MHWMLITLLLTGCAWSRTPADCGPPRDPVPLTPVFDGADAGREQVGARLVPVAERCGQITDIRFPPGQPDLMIVLDQAGVVRWRALSDGTHGEVMRLDVVEGWERGLLGLAFHPQFLQNGRFFLNYTLNVNGQLTSRVEEYRVSPGADLRQAKPEAVATLYELAQPFSNHNAGNLVFGPDGKLYIGWGDGGKAGDPQGHGQNGGTALGAMLRIDVDGARPFAVPDDNPKIDGWLPEVWAIGLRNPWRYTFDPAGRLVVADVGQNAWEEVGFLTAGSNAGWNVREGRHCYPASKACSSQGFLEPFYEYPHTEGQSITGGFVGGAGAGPLSGLYVFGDFVSGRIWALRLPEDVPGRVDQPLALGRFPIRISTFGQDAQGRLYVSSYDGTQAVYRIEPAGSGAQQ